MSCKPGPVPTPGHPNVGEDHSSRRHIAAPLWHSHPCAGALGRFGRAALDNAPIRACSGRGLPRRRSPGCRAWALTPRFHPYLCGRPESTAIGGVLSVALSLGSPRVGVIDLPAQRSPDFPLADDFRPPAILRPPPASYSLRMHSAKGNAFAPGGYRKIPRQDSGSTEYPVAYFTNILLILI